MSTSTPSGSSSSLSLVLALRGGSDEAWKKLVDLYAPLVRNWCLYSGVQENRVPDIVQEVFVAVFRKVESFERKDGTAGFRGWVWAITRNKIRDHFRAASAQPLASGGSTALFHLHAVADPLLPDDEPSEPNDTAALLHRALEMVRVDFKKQTWEVFWRAAIKGHSTDRIVEDLGVSAASVRQAKSRVLRRLRQQLGDMD